MSYTNEYDDIINMPHHVSKKHSRMPLPDRAAQFSPFAALVGYEDAIQEASRITDERINLDENTIEMLDIRLQLLKERLSEKPVVTISYFKTDEKKRGGSYETITGVIKKIDLDEHRIIVDDDFCVPLDDLLAIDGDIFNVL